MRLVFVDGALGNQVFQYIFLRYIEEMTGEDCMIDDMFFLHDYQGHHEFDDWTGYDLDRVFSIHRPRLSDFLDRDVIEEIRPETMWRPDFNQMFYNRTTKPKGILTLLKAAGMDLFPVQEGESYQAYYDYSGSIFSTPMNDYYPDVTRISGDLYYFGWWINGHWFEQIKDKLLKELQFPPLPDARNQEYIRQIQDAGNRSVSVHVRRGDFIAWGREMGSDVYANMLATMRKNLKRPVFFFFSDDLPFVKEHAKEYGIRPSDECVFVEGNHGEYDYVDMQLMSNCRGMILCNSSFSYLAHLLNTHPNKLIINPSGRPTIQ